MSIASWTSPPASALTLPISRVIRSESSGLCCSSSCAKRKRMLPRSGAGVRRQPSQASRAASTARSTSAAVERGNDSITSPVEGLNDSKVAVAVAMTAILVARGLRLRERPRGAGAPAIADRATLLVGVVELGRATVGAIAPVDDHRHVRVVLVVVDHLLVEVGLELARNDAEDHDLTIRTTSADARGAFASSAAGDHRRAMSGTMRPSSLMWAFQPVNAPSSCAGSCPRPSSRTGLSESGETRYWYQLMSQATVTTTSALIPESVTTETRGSPSDFAMPPTVRRYCDALKRTAASTIASSCSESRRRIGADATVSSTARGREPRRVCSQPWLFRLRSTGTVGDVGAPSRTQPYSIAVSAHSGQ